MFITFNCSQCLGSIEIDVQGVGARVTCPHCQAAITVPRTDLGAGTTIGGFKISAKLGEGGMGEVYLARQLSMDRNVALKILPATLSRQKDVSARFLNEVKFLAKLDHPHIVMAHEAGEDAGVLYLAMAYVEGESLEARLKREGMFSQGAALTIARKLAGALSYAWNRHQLLHRDIKPSNVLLDREGEPKLVDFGLAKSLSADTGLTMTTMLMGTPNYMSPEQAQDSAQVDTRADMYSLGALIYNLVTGEVPFAGTSVMEVIKKQITEPLPDPREYNAELSDGCVILMEIMLAKDREERPGSWEAVIADIDRVADGKSPTKALPETGASTLIRIRDLKRLAEMKGRSPRINVKKGEKGGKPGKRLTNKDRMKVWAWVGAGAAAVLMILVGVILLSGKNRTVPDSAQGLGTPGTGAVIIGESGTAPAPISDTDARAAKINQAYLSALEYVSLHPEDFNGSIGRFEEVRKDGTGTEYAQKAGEQIQRLEAAKRQKVETAWRGLKQAVEKLSDQKQYAEGILLLEQYAGPFAAEMDSDRKKLAEELAARDTAQKEEQAKQQAAEEEKKQKAEAQATEKKRQEAAQTRLSAVMVEAARGLLQGDYEAAAKYLASARGEEALVPVTNEIAAAAETAAKVAGMNNVILESYNQEKGREVAVEFRTGKVEKLRIVGVFGGKVKGKRELAGGFIERNFGVSDLSLREKTRRIGADASPAAGIMRGLLAYEAGDGKAAEACFKEAGFGLGAALSGLSGTPQTPLDVPVTSPVTAQSPAVAKLPARADAGGQELKKESTVTADPKTAKIPETPAESKVAVTPPTREAASGPELKKEFPPAATAGPKMARIPETLVEKAANAALIDILKLAGVDTDLTKLRDLMRQIAVKGYPEMKAAKIMEAVTAFEKTHGETETAKAYWRVLDFLKQASPFPRPPFLQATEENIKRAIEEWRVENNGAIGKVKSSIDKEGVFIEANDCRAQTVHALAYLPMWIFYKYGKTDISIDIASLADCPLRRLCLAHSPIKDYSVLKNIKTLQRLDLRGTDIRDLSVLQGLEDLDDLVVDQCNNLKDLSPLKGMKKLYALSVGPMVKDLAPLAECQLIRSLMINKCLVDDLNILKNFTELDRLCMINVPVKDLSPLRGRRLKFIQMEGVPATDLRVLAGMPLQHVTLGHRDGVMDLSFLEGADLDFLGVYGRVTAFAPLKKVTFNVSKEPMQLYLNVNWVKVPDAARLPEYIPALESICITSPGKAEAEIVLRFPNLKKVHVVSLPDTDYYYAKMMSFDEFKQKFGTKEKRDPKSAKPKPK